jgi:hypothetical protein
VRACVAGQCVDRQGATFLAAVNMKVSGVVIAGGLWWRGGDEGCCS